SAQGSLTGALFLSQRMTIVRFRSFLMEPGIGGCVPASDRVPQERGDCRWDGDFCDKKCRRFARARVSARKEKVGLVNARQDRDTPSNRQATARTGQGNCGREPASPLD